MLDHTPYRLFTSDTPALANRRVIQNLAASLCVAVGINQQDRHVVTLLGLGGERSNVEAMETWVRDQLARHTMEPSRESLPTLLSALLRLEYDYDEERRYG